MKKKAKVIKLRRIPQQSDWPLASEKSTPPIPSTSAVPLVTRIEELEAKAFMRGVIWTIAVEAAILALTVLAGYHM